MNPKTVKKDSEELIASNPFEEFNKSITGKEAEVVNGKRLPPKKKDSNTMGKPLEAEDNAFTEFNNTLKKKDGPAPGSVSGGGVSNVVGSPGASTSSSNGENPASPVDNATFLKSLQPAPAFTSSKSTVEGSEGASQSPRPGEISKAKQNYDNATGFLTEDVAKQTQDKSLYPAIMGPNGQPLPNEAQPGQSSVLDGPIKGNVSKMPDQMRVLNNVDDLKKYVDMRNSQMNDNINELQRQREELVVENNETDYNQPGGMVKKATRYISDKAKYNALGSKIDQMTQYQKDLRKNASTVVSDLLVKKHLFDYPEGQPILIETDQNGKEIKTGMIGSPKNLGRDIVRYADKHSDDQFKFLEKNKGDLGPVVSADLEQIGLTAWKDYLLTHDDVPNREKYIDDLSSWAGDFDLRHYELTAARVRHKIGAELQKKSGFGSSIFRRKPSEAMITEAAEGAELTPSEMRVFRKYVLPQEKESAGTDIPMSGFFNKVGEAVAENWENLGNTFMNSDADRLYQGLNQEVNTRFDEVGEFQRDKGELLALEKKSKSKQGLDADETKRMNELKNYNDVRNWYDKFWDGAGDLTGQVAYQAGIARLFGGVGSVASKAPVVGGLISKGTTILGGADKINLMVTSFLTSYDNHAKDAVMLMPGEDQSLQRRLYSWTMASVEGFSERIFNDTKVFDAFKRELKPEVVKLSGRLAANEISEEAARSRLQSIIANKLKPFGKEFAKSEFQESTEEAIVDLAQGISDSVFSGRDFDAEGTFGNAANTFLTTMAYSPFVSGLAATKDIRAGGYGKSGIYKMAEDPESFRREIHRLQQEGLPQEDADKRLQIINTAAEIAKQLPKKKSLDPKKNSELTALNTQWKENINSIDQRDDITPEEKENLKTKEDARAADEIATYVKNQNAINSAALDYPDRVNYLTHRLNETLLDKQISETSDDVIKADLERQRDRSKKIREGIFNGNIISGNNLEEIATDPKVAEELGITALEKASDDTLPINISKPKISEDEKQLQQGNAGQRQQTGEESQGSEHIGEQEGLNQQTVPADKEPVEETPVTPGEEAKVSLPPGMTESQFKSLPKKTQEKIIANQNQLESQRVSAKKKLDEDQAAQQAAAEPAPTAPEPAPVAEAPLSDEFNKAEKNAINSIRKKDLSKTGLASYAAIVNNPDSTPDQVKEALKGISNQLTANGTAEQTGSALGVKLSDAIYDLDYPVVEDTKATAEAAGGKPLSTFTPQELNQRKAELQNALKIPALPEEDRANINEELDRINALQPQKEPAPAQPRKTADVYYEPITNINTDVERFQPRGTDFSPESVEKIIANYDDNKLDPVVLYNDPKNGKQYILAGHSRLEAHRQLSEMPDSDPRKQNAIANGFQQGNIKARTFNGTEQEAKEFADRSNDLGTKNKDYESANSLRKARLDGQTKKAIQDRAKTDFGKNWRYLYNMSYLNPKGKALQTLKQFESNPDKNVQNQIEKAVQWIGAVRERLGDLVTDAHENEMFDYLMDKGRSTKLDRENDFIGLIGNMVGTFDYNPAQPLNLNRITNKSQAEVNYDTEEAEIKNSIKEKQAEVDSLNDRLNNPQNAAYVNPNAPDYADVQKVADKKRTKLNTELASLRKELVEHQQNKGKAISTGMAQPGLFDVNNLSPAEQTQLDEELKPDEITVQNISDYEASQSIPDTEEVQETGGDNTGQTSTVPADVQPAENVEGPGAGEDQSRPAVQRRERASTTLKTMEGKSPNEHGVFTGDDIQRYTLPSKKYPNTAIPRAEVEYTQLDNGNWIADRSYTINDGGTNSPLTIHDEQFPTKREAVLNALAKIEKGIQGKPNNAAYQKWIDETRAQVLAEAPTETTVPAAPVTAPDVDVALQQKQQKLADAKQAFKDSLRKMRGKTNSFIVPIDPEVIANGVKLVAAYADLGIYKFKEIISDIADTFGGDYLDKQNVDALKGVYSYYRSNLPKEQRGTFDNEDSVDDFIERDLQAYTSPATDMTEEQFLQQQITESEQDGAEDTAQMYRDDLELLNTNPYQYWKDLYEAYDQDLTNERRAEAFEQMQKHNPNATDSPTSLATDSTRGTIDDSVGEPDVSDERPGGGNILERPSREVISTVQPESSPGLLPFDAPTVRETGDSGLPFEERNVQSATGITRSPDSGRGNPIDEAGIPLTPGGDESIEGDAESITGQSIEEKITAQKAAEPIAVKVGDIDNIRETLPFLMPGQHGDVYKAEQRFVNDASDPEKLYGKAILFTNGTGTGKTLTGLGIAKRMFKQGKKNILVVVPSDVKAKDWIVESQDFMQMPMHQLTDTQDRGKEVNVTTYANFRLNPYIQNREWDLVMYDESHKINSNGAGSLTSAEAAHNTATSSPTVAKQKAKVAIRYEEKRTAIFDANARAREAGKYNEVDTESVKKLDEELRQQTIREFKKTKVVFLSATPFAYHPNLTYADGYLFKIQEGFDPDEGKTYGYNEPNAYNNFYVSNFGYRMRYNKLTRPESGVDMDLLERQFTESLKNKGVVVSRKLDVDKDYSRQFVLVDNELGRMIDEGIDKMSNHEKYPYLTQNVNKQFTFLYKNQLMEGVKAKWAVDRIRQHLALGRKVVVSHTYIENEPRHPFRFHASDIMSPLDDQYQRVQADIEAFAIDHPEYRNLDMRGLKAPIKTISEAFPNQVVLFNGRETKKDRNIAKKLFNDDNSGKDIIIVQMDAGKEGISLHDRTGVKQRAEMNLGLPYKPTDAIQIEGRIYRTGQKTDAVIEYPVLNLNFEKFAYALKINERVRTAENLALGEEARNMETAFKEGYANATSEEASLEQGKGGKQEDARMDSTTEFDRAKTYYYKRGKRSAQQKAKVEGDYYATPEPLGMKMVEWANLVPNEKGLEPSVGHGAIGRFFPRTTNNIFIEPNADLRSETALNVFGEVKAGNFEDLYIGNKFDAVVMNPPFGRGGKTAMDHLIKATGHLHDGGRIVALVPTGQMNNRIADWQDSDESKGFYVTARIQLPNVTFERAGTKVATQIIVIDKQLKPGAAASLPSQRNIDLSGYENIKEFFDAIEDLSLPDRISPGQYAVEAHNKPAPVEATAAPKETLPVGVSEFAEVVKNFHDKLQRDNWVVAIKKRVDNVEFNQLRDMAKDMGGYYSAFKGKGAIPGFQFDNEQAANNFYSNISGQAMPGGERMSLADRIRTWKISKSAQNLYSTIIPGGPHIWNTAVEIAATAVEAGEALIDALAKARNYIEQNWKKSWQHSKYGPEMIMELKGRGVLTYDLTDDQRNEADAAISRIQRTGKLIKEVNALREGFDIAKKSLTDPADIKELEDSYNEFERYIFDGLSASEIENMHDFSLNLDDQKWWEKQKENWHNKYQRLEQVQKEIEKAGITIEEKNDMVNRADRWRSIAAAKIDNILREVGLSDVDVFIWKGRQKLEDSLFDQMAKDGVDYRKFNLYMYARHAPERNAHNAKVRRENFAKKIAQIETDLQKYKDSLLITPSPTLRGLITRKENELAAYEEYQKAYDTPGSNANYIKLLEKKIDYKFRLMDDGGSGMTNDQAAEILNEVKAEGAEAKFGKYETAMREKVIQTNLDLQKEYGLLDEESYEYLNNYYQNYIPLKVDDSFFENGQTYSESNIPGAKIYKSKGAANYTFENRTNPVTQSVIDLQATIYEGEHNRYKQTISETIKSAPDKDVWELKSASYAPIKDKQGKVVGLDEIDVPPNGISFYDNGQKKYLVINDKALLDAMTHANVKNAIPILSKINGIFRSLWTVYNPAFTVTNLFRDVETAGIVLSATQKGDAAKLFRNNVGKIFGIIKAIYKQQGGSEKTYWEQRSKEYKDAGGQMTWFKQETTEDMIKDIEGAYNKYNQSGAFDAGKNLGLKVADFVNRANTAVENSTRLAIYDAMLKSGVPQHKAVEVARNATINFNKKGNYGAMADSLYLFFNASVQGTANVMKTMLTTKRGMKLAGGIVLAGMLLSLYNNAMSDCDDPADAANCYDNIPDYEKERNIIIKIPGGKGFLKIPLAWGFNVFFNAGEQLGQGITGKTDISHAIAFVAKSAFNSFNPTGSVDQPLLQHISPTATDPIVQYFTNKDAFGRPIWNDYEFDRRPDSQRGSSADSRGARDMAAWMNRASGGNNKVKGSVDVAPGTLDWFFETFTGGLGQFTSQTVGSTRAAFDPREDVDVRKIPIVNRFYTAPRERSDRSMIFDAVDDSYNTIMSPEKIKAFNTELDKALRLNEVAPDKAKTYRLRVTKNQYELNHPATFELIDRSKVQLISQEEIDAFVEDLKAKVESEEIPKEWIGPYKAEITKNQKKFKP